MIALPGVELGFVTRRDDPDGLGRVKVLIPGLFEPETPNWAEPLGAPGGGSAQRGTFDPPAVDATVAVFFHRGDPDRPFYLVGPWGAPQGVSDAPTGAEVEGDDRGQAVTEDPEWLLQRDSRTASPVKRWRVRHKSSGLEVVLEGDDHLRLVRQSASQALVRGTEYRLAEANLLSSLLTALQVFATACGLSIDAVIVAAAGALSASITPLQADTLATDATAYLSTKAFTE
jgi:hypothetical protein